MWITRKTLEAHRGVKSVTAAQVQALIPGRSYAEVDAVSHRLFQAAFAVGGKFNGDSWTSPAILAGA